MLHVQVALLVALPGGAEAQSKIITSFTPSSDAKMASLMWQSTPAPLTPANFTIMFPGETWTTGDRLEIHLPGFGGAYNSFGATSPGAGALEGNFLPIQNGISPYSRADQQDATNPADEDTLINECISTAEWDAKREVLKIKVGTIGATTCTAINFNGVTIDEAYLRQYYSRGGLPSGKGPLPPRGGIDGEWYKKAWMRRFLAAACTGESDEGDRDGMGSEICDVESMTEYTFDRDTAHQSEFETTHDFVPTQHVGAFGTMAKPAFAWLAAKGKKTAIGDENCITVTMIPSVTLASPSPPASTTFTLSGLTGSDEADTKTLQLYAGGGCSHTPAKADKNDNTNSIRQEAGSSDPDVLTSPDGKAWQGKWDKDEGKLEVSIGTYHYIAAGEAFTFSFKVTNGPTAQVCISPCSTLSKHSAPIYPCWHSLPRGIARY